MGVDCKAVFGVGVREKDIKFSTLTLQSKQTVLECCEYELQAVHGFVYDDLVEVFLNNESSELLDEWFAENKYEHDLFCHLGLEGYTGSCYSGDVEWRGVSVNVTGMTLSQASQNIEHAVQSFKSVVNLEPALFSDMLIS